jgi:nitroreductase
VGCHGSLGRGQVTAERAANIALVVPLADDPYTREMTQYDLGRVTMSIMLTAGVGSGHAAVEAQQLARDILGFPEDRFCARLIALGYPADRPLRPVREPKRRPLADVVHRE